MKQETETSVTWDWNTWLYYFPHVIWMPSYLVLSENGLFYLTVNYFWKKRNYFLTYIYFWKVNKQVLSFTGRFLTHHPSDPFVEEMRDQEETWDGRSNSRERHHYIGFVSTCVVQWGQRDVIDRLYISVVQLK